MFSCGMYDYSGQWCVNVGLPAKSGVAGLVYIVVPNVMGVAVYSPRLDSHGNSVRAVEFARRLLKQVVIPAGSGSRASHAVVAPYCCRPCCHRRHFAVVLGEPASPLPFGTVNCRMC